MLDVASNLLGWRLFGDVDGERVVAEIDEVEAYGGEADPASHAFRGPTPRNQVMFGEPGTLYVYRSYGIHWCMNVVAGPAGTARAVLLRGARIVVGEGTVRRRRGRADHLADGPGKLTQAFGVTERLNGHRLTRKPLRLLPPVRTVARIDTSPRIGISKAVDRPWRMTVGEWADEEKSAD